MTRYRKEMICRMILNLESNPVIFVSGPESHTTFFEISVVLLMASTFITWKFIDRKQGLNK